MKIKLNGRKQRIKILGWDDIIDEGDLWAWIGEIDNKEKYEAYINSLSKTDLERMRFLPSNCAGEAVNDCHYCRVYIRMLNN